MTPAELITRNIRDALEGSGVPVPVESLLLEALDGTKHESASSGVAVKVHVSGQLEEPLPHYTFALSVGIAIALDDDKGGHLFKQTHDAVWGVFNRLAEGDNCTELGDEGEVFAVDGFQIEEGEPPDFQTDENGGTWTCSFAATITGRA